MKRQRDVVNQGNHCVYVIDRCIDFSVHIWWVPSPAPFHSRIHVEKLEQWEEGEIVKNSVFLSLINRYLNVERIQINGHLYIGTPPTNIRSRSSSFKCGLGLDFYGVCVITMQFLFHCDSSYLGMSWQIKQEHKRWGSVLLTNIRVAKLLVWQAKPDCEFKKGSRETDTHLNDKD